MIESWKTYSRYASRGSARVYDQVGLMGFGIRADETRLNGLGLSPQPFKSLIKFGAVFPSQMNVARCPRITGLPDCLARRMVDFDIVIC